MTDRFDITSYVFDPNKGYFVDTNIWLFIDGPMPPTEARSRTYSMAMKRLMTSGAKIFVDVLVVSEFMNRFARMEYTQAGGESSYGGFKQYRRSPAFPAVAADIASAVRRMLKTAQRTGTPFANIDVDPVLGLYATGTVDLADALMCESCGTKGHILITDDADMDSAPIPIVTANRKLLP